MHFVTRDKGSNFEEMTVPVAPVMTLQGTILSFHNAEPDYLIYMSERGCDGYLSRHCHSEAFYSHDDGRTWHSIGTYMRSCIWGRSGAIDKTDYHSIFCERYRERSGNQQLLFGSPVQLIGSLNYFTDTKVIFDDIAGIAVFGKYMTVAVVSGNLLLDMIDY